MRHLRFLLLIILHGIWCESNCQIDIIYDTLYFENSFTVEIIVYDTITSFKATNSQLFKYDIASKKLVAFYEKNGNGQIVGNYYNYHSNGSIKELIKYERGYREGNYLEFHDNGKIKVIGFYKKLSDLDKDALCKEVPFEDTEVGLFGYNLVCSDGVKCNNWLFFDENGDLIDSKIFRK